MTTMPLRVGSSITSRPWLADLLVVLGLSLFTGILSGSQRWTGQDTPDSSFYASLALNGDEVTDRAPITSYYWTRLGYIVPVRILTSVLGPFPGFYVYRLLLILLIVAAAYLALRALTSVPAAATLTALISLNTVLLGYLGNTYLTGSTLAGLFIVIACGVRPTWRGRHWPVAALAGATLGWLVMVNPYGAILAGVIWAVAALRPLNARTIITRYVVAVLAASTVFLLYLLSGRFVFPKMNWLGTYLEWNGKLNYSDFASKDLVWLHDISMLVIVAAFVVSLIAWARNPAQLANRLSIVLISTTIVFALLFLPVMGGITLEAPMYQAMLWPSALMALALSATRITADQRWPAWMYAVAAACVVVVIAAGHWPGAFSFALGVSLALVVAAAVGAVLAQTRTLVLALVAVTVFLIAAQLLQNSRGPLGLYYLSPYSNAFNSNPISDKVHTAVNVEDWLLAHTTRDDQILLWVDGDWVNGDRELYSVAAMQLWGENRVTLEKTLTPDDITRLRSLKPTTLALYGPDMQGITRFWSTIPQDLTPTSPVCTDFTWPVRFPVGHACLTTLHWTSP